MLTGGALAGAVLAGGAPAGALLSAGRRGRLAGLRVSSTHCFFLWTATNPTEAVGTGARELPCEELVGLHTFDHMQSPRALQGLHSTVSVPCDRSTVNVKEGTETVLAGIVPRLLVQVAIVAKIE